jgi:peptide/nickel transport system ATP-binding protein/oligopeptide transport system ATP-binding protein
MKLLEVENLKTYFHTDDGIAKAVDGVSFSLEKGKVIGIVGESGCGKSVTSLSIMGLIDPITGRNEGGQILFHGENLLAMKQKDLRKIRGNQISMIFQEPMTSLNPVYTIGHQIDEAIILHLKLNKQDARARTIDLLQKVGIPEAARRVNEYPHQLSGGMRQRVMIAMALSCNPEVLIADEPTTALDVTIQAQILKLLSDIKRGLDMAIIIITHDLGVIAEMADEVAVMYAGQIVERAHNRQLFEHPSHPYTRGLLGSIPDITTDVNRLQVLEGLVPSLYNMPAGCRFAPRCKYAEPKCGSGEIPLVKLESGAECRCIGGVVHE